MYQEHRYLSAWSADEQWDVVVRKRGLARVDIFRAAWSDRKARVAGEYLFARFPAAARIFVTTFTFLLLPWNVMPLRTRINQHP